MGSVVHFRNGLSLFTETHGVFKNYISHDTFQIAFRIRKLLWEN